MNRSLIAIVIVLFIAGLAAADQGRTEIGPTTTFPIVIDTPGSYVLTADLHVTTDEANGIEIEADNVIIDLGGHVLRGPGQALASGVGVYGLNRLNVAIKNGTVIEFDDGINLSGYYSRGNRFSDLTVSHCGDSGIFFEHGTAKDIAVHSNAGVGLLCVHCLISNVTAIENHTGIAVLEASVSNCISNKNVAVGFNLTTCSFNGGSARGNGATGVTAGGGCTIVGVSVAVNGGWGIELNANGANTVVNSSGINNTLGNISGCGNGNNCFQNTMP